MVIAQQALRDLYGLDWAKGKRTVSGAAVKFPADWGEDLTGVNLLGPHLLA